MTFTDSMTLAEAREELRGLVRDGHRCPCCTQFAKIYRRKINSTMARDAIQLYRAGGEFEFVHGPSLPGGAHREISQLSWWGLIADEGSRRDDGGRAGFWKLTVRGAMWVRDQTVVPKYALVYDSRCLGLETTPLVGIRDSLGDRFDYRELMND